MAPAAAGGMPMPPPPSQAPAGMSQGMPSGMHSDGVMQGGMMQRDGMHGGMAGHGMADGNGHMAAAHQVGQAQAALRRGRTAEATNLLEQAETQLLNRPTMPGQAMQDPALAQLSAARGALQSRDRAAAMREIDQALASLHGGEMTSGSDMKSGGPAMQGGSRSMRDGGTAGRSMSRADHIVRVQGSPPASGAANPGAMMAPPSGMGTTTQPSLGNSTTGADAGGRGLPGSTAGGLGAPTPGMSPPGSTAPLASGTGRSSSGGPVSSGLPNSTTTPPR